jgi:hypothetical protein
MEIYNLTDPFIELYPELKWFTWSTPVILQLLHNGFIIS